MVYLIYRDNVVSCDECGLQYESRLQKYMHPYIHMGHDIYMKAYEHRYHIMQPFLLTTHQHGEYACQTFNVPLLPDRAVSKEYILRDLQQILYAIDGRQFKVKVGVSRILRHDPTGKLQFLPVNMMVNVWWPRQETVLLYTTIV